MKRKHLSFQFKMISLQTKDATEDCIIEGFANTSDKDRVGDVVLPSAFTNSMKTYMSNPVLLANHDWNDPCGVVTSAEIQDKGLFIQAKISATRPDIKTLIREGVLRTFSIGYNELDADIDEATQTKFIKALELLEISIVTVPANAMALFTEVGSNLPKQGDKPVDGATPTAGAPEKGAKPGSTKGSTMESCMSDTISQLVDAGHEQDQAVAIAYKMCGEGKSCPTAETIKSLTGLIGDVKSVLGKEKLDGQTLIAIVDHFTKGTEIMTKAELLALLKTKFAPTSGKKDSAAAPAEEAPAGNNDPSGAAATDPAALAKMVEACLARLDTIGEAVAKLMEAAGDSDAGTPPAKPADAPDAAPAKPADPAKKPDPAKPAEPGKDAAAAPADPAKKPDGDEADDEEEMSDEDAQKALDDITAQIAKLEDESNS